VLPDENGAIESYHSVSFNFLDGSAVVPGLINYYGTETMAELCDYYASSGIYNVECRRIIMTSGDRARSRNCIGEEIVKDADGNVTGRRLFFGDDLCPVILDIASNKIIFDPDWVAPTPCVKTINGIAPDENGDIVVKTPRECLFVDASAMVPGLVQSFWPVGTIIDTYRNESAAMRFGLEVVDATTQKNGPTISHTASDIETITDDAGNTGYKIIIWFGDNHVPIIVNGLTNTITLDPDWVAPEANITESAANTLVDTKVAELSTTVDTKLSELAAQELSLPKSAGAVDHGTAGQFAVSDGMGGIMWKTLVEAEEVAY
jgi:hypothetical protein